MSRRSTRTRPKPQPVVLREVKAARPNPRADAVALAALVALQVVFWWRALLLRGFLLTSDICYQFEPYKAYLHEALRAGRLALWTPYLYAGYPVGAEGQTATFSPPSLLFSWLFSGGGAVNWLLFFHLVVAGIGLYLLARTLGISPFGAWAGAATFSFAGYFFAHLHHVGIICTAAWLPLIILFVERAWRARPLPNAAMAALLWALAAVAGHPQTLFHISLVVLFWIAWRTLGARRTGVKAGPRRAATVLATIFVLGAGLAAVQLLLTRDLSAAAPHGERGSLAYVTGYSLLPEHLFGLLLPNWQGSPAFANYAGEAYYWEYVLYLGLLPLLLALIGAATRRGWIFAGLAAGALVLALAEGNPLYEVLRHVPGFADFRVPARFIYVFTFAAALLVGIGWDTFAGKRRMLRGRRLHLAAGLAALLIVADLWRFDGTLAHLASREAYQAPQPVAEAMRGDGAWGRLLVIPPVSFTANWTPGGGWARRPDGWAEPRLLLATDAPQSYDLPSIYGYVGFEDPVYRDLFMAMGPRVYAGNLDLASLLGVRDIYVTDGSVSFPALARQQVSGLAYTQSRPWLYRNPGAFPRVFAVGEVIPAQSTSEAQAAVLALADRGALRRTAVTLGELGEFHPQPDPVVKAEVREPRPEHIIVRAASDREALLVLNERWDQGWQARRDGRPAPLVRADAMLMGTPLPKGEHTVEFVYRPRGLVVGRAISLVALVLWAGLVAVGLWGKLGNRESKAESDGRRQS
jgi:hypothetical protein